MSKLNLSFVSPHLNDSAIAFATTQLAFLTLFATVILSVPRHATLTRLVSLLPLCALTYMLQQTFFHLCGNPHWRAAAAPLVWIQYLSASDMIWVSRVHSAHIPSSSSGGAERSVVIRARRVVALLWNLRRVGTRWQVKNVSSDGSASSSRARFVLRRATTTFFAYVVLDIMVSGPSPDSALVRAPKETLLQLDRLSIDDVIFRTIGTVSFWLSSALLNLIMSNSVAIMSVLTGLSSPADCPPLYGPIGEAYSIRRFWGVSWHQCLRHVLTGHADMVADSALPIPRATPLSRYTRLTLAFFLSGLIHHSSDLAMGIPRADAGSLFFFLLQPLGIILEDGWLSLTRHVAIQKPRSRRWRIVGYLWVLIFLTWSTPTWFYPQQRLGIDPGNLLPFRIVGPAARWVQGFMQG